MVFEAVEVSISSHVPSRAPLPPAKYWRVIPGSRDGEHRAQTLTRRASPLFTGVFSPNHGILKYAYVEDFEEAWRVYVYVRQAGGNDRRLHTCVPAHCMRTLIKPCLHACACLPPTFRLVGITCATGHAPGTPTCSFAMQAVSI